VSINPGGMRMFSAYRRSATVAAAAAVALLAGGVAATISAADSAGGPPSTGTGHDQVAIVVTGSGLSHTFLPSGATTTVTAALTKPDDITRDGNHLFVAFQNGVGPQGEAATSGNTDSTVVEFTPGGHEVAEWDLVGKCDGLTADPAHNDLVATVDEDANSSLYTIPIGGGSPDHYAYGAPLPHNGGTDAISVVDGSLFISASAPGTTGAAAPEPTYPAVYRVTLDPATLIATASEVFGDEATATDVTAGPGEGSPQQLALTDPDSNEVVPAVSPRFAGDFLLTSQGDSEQIYVSHPGSASPGLSVLNLTQAGQVQSVDDTAWPTRQGTLYFSDSANDTIDEVSGGFDPGTAYVAVTPCGLNSAPGTCPAPGYPANFLGTLNLWTGAITPLSLPDLGGVQPQPGGMIFVPRDRGEGN
jgi:hypothetical protein